MQQTGETKRESNNRYIVSSPCVPLPVPLPPLVRYMYIHMYERKAIGRIKHHRVEHEPLSAPPLHRLFSDGSSFAKASEAFFFLFFAVDVERQQFSSRKIRSPKKRHIHIKGTHPKTNSNDNSSQTFERVISILFREILTFSIKIIDPKRLSETRFAIKNTIIYVCNVISSRLCRFPHVSKLHLQCL